MIKVKITGLNEAIRKVENLHKTLPERNKRFLERLAEIGAKVARSSFYEAGADGIVTGFEWRGENTLVMYAQGKEVAFWEFGTGVYYNPTDPYPIPRPAGVKGIGEYGKGYGKRRAWAYKEESGERVVTRGIPASKSMWEGYKSMRDRIGEIAREVFGGK